MPATVCWVGKGEATGGDTADEGKEGEIDGEPDDDECRFLKAVWRAVEHDGVGVVGEAALGALVGRGKSAEVVITDRAVGQEWL